MTAASTVMPTLRTMQEIFNVTPFIRGVLTTFNFTTGGSRCTHRFPVADGFGGWISLDSAEISIRIRASEKRHDALWPEMARGPEWYIDSKAVNVYVAF